MKDQKSISGLVKRSATIRWCLLLPWQGLTSHWHRQNQTRQGQPRGGGLKFLPVWVKVGQWGKGRLGSVWGPMQAAIKPHVAAYSRVSLTAPWSIGSQSWKHNLGKNVSQIERLTEKSLGFHLSLGGFILGFLLFCNVFCQLSKCFNYLRVNKDLSFFLP